MTKGKTLIMAAGGTGGHVFTAIATAEELVKRGFNVKFLTDRRGEKYLKDKIFSYKIITSASPKGFISAIKLSWGVFQSFFYLLFRRAKLVIGFGGYPSFPPMLAAKLLGIKTILHEQNSILGKANRVLAKSAAAVATAFPETINTSRVVYTGQPVRADIQAVDYPPISDFINILITGGSQGAKLFAEILPAALCQFAGRISVTHQVPDNKIAEVNEAYLSCGLAHEVMSFFNDMPERLAKAHVLIARGGASTVFELATVGRPAIFIPLKIAADNHQLHNVEAVCRAGGGWLVEEKDLHAKSISDILQQVLAEPQQLKIAAEKIKTFAQPEAAANLAELAEKMLEK